MSHNRNQWLNHPTFPSLHSTPLHFIHIKSFALNVFKSIDIDHGIHDRGNNNIESMGFLVSILIFILNFLLFISKRSHWSTFHWLERSSKSKQENIEETTGMKLNETLKNTQKQSISTRRPRTVTTNKNV